MRLLLGRVLGACLIAGILIAPGSGSAAPAPALEVSEDAGLGRIEVHGNIGAVLQRDEGTVAVLDLKNPARPQVLGRYDSAKASLDGDLAFSRDGRWLFYARQTSNFDEEGIHVLDVSDPSDPTLAFYLPAGGAYRVQYIKQGDAEWVVLLDAIDGLVVSRFVPQTGALIPVHIDPLPVLKVGGPASAGLFYDPKDAALDSPLLYVTTGRTGLQVFDYSNPLEPRELGAWSDVGLAEIEVQATKKGRTVYAATEYWFDKRIPPEVVVLDASDLDDITERRRIGLKLPPEEGNWIQGMTLARGRLYVAHSAQGLVGFDPRSGRRVMAHRPTGKRNPNAGVMSSPYSIDIEVSGRWGYLTDASLGTVESLRL